MKHFFCLSHRCIPMGLWRASVFMQTVICGLVAWTPSSCVFWQTTQDIFTSHHGCKLTFLFFSCCSGYIYSSNMVSWAACRAISILVQSVLCVGTNECLKKRKKRKKDQCFCCCSFSQLSETITWTMTCETYSELQQDELLLPGSKRKSKAFRPDNVRWASLFFTFIVQKLHTDKPKN